MFHPSIFYGSSSCTQGHAGCWIVSQLSWWRHTGQVASYLQSHRVKGTNNQDSRSLQQSISGVSRACLSSVGRNQSIWSPDTLVLPRFWTEPGSETAGCSSLLPEPMLTQEEHATKKKKKNRPAKLRCLNRNPELEFLI